MNIMEINPKTQTAGIVTSSVQKRKRRVKRSERRATQGTSKVPIINVRKFLGISTMRNKPKKINRTVLLVPISKAYPKNEQVSFPRINEKKPRKSEKYPKILRGSRNILN